MLFNLDLLSNRNSIFSLIDRFCKLLSISSDFKLVVVVKTYLFQVNCFLLRYYHFSIHGIHNLLCDLSPHIHQ